MSVCQVVAKNLRSGAIGEKEVEGSTIVLYLSSTLSFLARFAKKNTREAYFSSRPSDPPTPGCSINSQFDILS
jgi:hypothetical protein